MDDEKISESFHRALRSADVATAMELLATDRVEPYSLYRFAMPLATVMVPPIVTLSEGLSTHFPSSEDAYDADRTDVRAAYDPLLADLAGRRFPLFCTPSALNQSLDRDSQRTLADYSGYLIYVLSAHQFVATEQALVEKTAGLGLTPTISQWIAQTSLNGTGEHAEALTAPLADRIRSQASEAVVETIKASAPGGARPRPRSL